MFPEKLVMAFILFTLNITPYYIIPQPCHIPADRNGYGGFFCRLWVWNPLTAWV